MCGQEALSGRYHVSGIPTLVILSPSGDVITTKGREKVMGNPGGEQKQGDARQHCARADAASLQLCRLPVEVKVQDSRPTSKRVSINAYVHEHSNKQRAFVHCPAYL